jgi:hypothetical protein
MTSATDTPAERIAEYRRLFAQSLLGRARTSTGIRFRFRADPGLAEWVRDLARRERACCAFFSFSVYASDAEIWWDISVVDDEMARRILAEFYRLPGTVAEGDTVHRRFADQGLRIVTDGGQPPRPAQPAGGNCRRDAAGELETAQPGN